MLTAPGSFCTVWCPAAIVPATRSAKLYDKVFKDTVITCTVTFNDGTSQKRQIGIGGAVMTYEELGTQTDEPVESPEDPSQKQAFLKLQIK